MANTTADREVVVSRVFDAPPELVFSAFTEREHVENWWVPAGTTIHEWDPIPGGLWRYSMPAPDGTQLPFRIKFIEIARPTKLVYDYATDADLAPDPVRTTVTFDEQDGKTRVTLQLVFATAAAYQEALKYGAVGGAKMALEALAKHLATI